VDVFIYQYLDIKKRTETEEDTTTIPNIVSTSNDLSSSGIVNITWMDMRYLWRSFLESKCLPTIMFQYQSEMYIKSKLNVYFNEELDCFIGISCKHLPAIKNFISFWEQTIQMTDDLSLEYEVNEIGFLFKKWCERNRIDNKFMNEKQILDLIHYFYPDVEVDREKYIYKIKCCIWDKHIDIHAALDSLKAAVENGDFIRDVSSNTKMTMTTTPTMTNRIHHHSLTETETLRSDSQGHLSAFYREDQPINKHIPNVNSLGSISSCVSSDIHLKISICDAYVYYCKYSVNLYGLSEQTASKTFFEKYLYEIHLSYPFIEI
jgi:hypothetical protein